MGPPSHLLARAFGARTRERVLPWLCAFLRASHPFHLPCPASAVPSKQGQQLCCVQKGLASGSKQVTCLNEEGAFWSTWLADSPTRCDMENRLDFLDSCSAMVLCAPVRKRNARVQRQGVSMSTAGPQAEDNGRGERAARVTAHEQICKTAIQVGWMKGRRCPMGYAAPDTV